ncbi:hypothetical protein [Micromonospora sp. HK10]|uniref:hypothetical protein n=1 Tax=Micromonospora sp. HK10 TaxID=1538294 RepID=UPI000627394A|nr:hypothetical protein [Micromonospora sp. HK10]KKK05235.1 hypothetical protein LQ51_14305 [Micromonospora sp. HK10]
MAIQHAVLTLLARGPSGHLLRELRNLDGLRRGADDPVVRLLLSAAGRHVEADLAFVDDAEAALLADGGATLAGLATEATARSVAERIAEQVRTASSVG